MPEGVSELFRISIYRIFSTLSGTCRSLIHSHHSKSFKRKNIVNIIIGIEWLKMCDMNWPANTIIVF